MIPTLKIQRRFKEDVFKRKEGCCGFRTEFLHSASTASGTITRSFELSILLMTTVLKNVILFKYFGMFITLSN